MKDLSINEMEIMLCSTGYIPPRNEEELLFFNELYENYDSRIKNRHVDIEAIFNGLNCVVLNYIYVDKQSSRDCKMVAEDENHEYSMAARNYGRLPKDILAKMRNQHKPKDDED